MTVAFTFSRCTGLTRPSPGCVVVSWRPTAADFQYGGNAKAALGAEIGIPAGRSNTLRVSYFRVQGNSGVTLGKDALIFGESYTAGEFLNATYKLQAIKASWDYLSYSWHKPSTTIRLKTLYEVQYVTTTFDTAAPFVPATTDATGNTDTNQANGTKSVILPTFGMALGSSFGSRFRWDIRGSGLGFPKRGASPTCKVRWLCGFPKSRSSRAKNSFTSRLHRVPTCTPTTRCRAFSAAFGWRLEAISNSNG